MHVCLKPETERKTCCREVRVIGDDLQLVVESILDGQRYTVRNMEAMSLISDLWWWTAMSNAMLSYVAKLHWFLMLHASVTLVERGRSP